MILLCHREITFPLPLNSFWSLCAFPRTVTHRGGGFSTGVTMKKSWKNRFWNKVNKDGQIPTHMPHLGKCWIWTACKDRNGCGRFGLNRENQLASRVSWGIHNGKIPKGLYVFHHCDNKLCVNPSHLFLGTQTDNMLDMKTKKRHFWSNRTKCKNGHSLSGDNLGIDRNRHRRCNTCYKAYHKKYRERKHAIAP